MNMDVSQYSALLCGVLFDNKFVFKLNLLFFSLNHMVFEYIIIRYSFNSSGMKSLQSLICLYNVFISQVYPHNNRRSEVVKREEAQTRGGINIILNITQQNNNLLFFILKLYNHRSNSYSTSILKENYVLRNTYPDK